MTVTREVKITAAAAFLAVAALPAGAQAPSSSDIGFANSLAGGVQGLAVAFPWFGRKPDAKKAAQAVERALQALQWADAYDEVVYQACEDKERQPTCSKAIESYLKLLDQAVQSSKRAVDLLAGLSQEDAKLVQPSYDKLKEALDDDGCELSEEDHLQPDERVRYEEHKVRLQVLKGRVERNYSTDD